MCFACSYLPSANEVDTAISIYKAVDSAVKSSNTLYQSAQCTRVVDGDTIVVQMDGSEYKLRYIGIDTPETVDPNRPVGYFGKEASARNKQLVEGKTLYLEKDVSDTDKYGRLLRYIYLDINGDGSKYTMVNSLLVQLGYAKVATYPPDVKYADLFIKMEREARENNRGLWAE